MPSTVSDLALQMKSGPVSWAAQEVALTRENSFHLLQTAGRGDCNPQKLHFPAQLQMQHASNKHCIQCHGDISQQQMSTSTGVHRRIHFSVCSCQIPRNLFPKHPDRAQACAAQSLHDSSTWLCWHIHSLGHTPHFSKGSHTGFEISPPPACKQTGQAQLCQIARCDGHGTFSRVMSYFKKTEGKLTCRSPTGQALCSAPLNTSLSWWS